MNKFREFFVPKKPLIKWWVGRSFLFYLFISALWGISDYLAEKPFATKTSGPTQAQWEGYSKCLENIYQTSFPSVRESTCRSEFNIPWNIDY